MGKSISGTPLYELKVTNPNSIANFSEPKLAEAAANDFTTYVGRQIQGFAIKGTDAKALIEKVKKDLVAKKVEQPWIRAGVSGADLILLVTDLKSSKYEQSCVLFSGYIAMREKQKKETAMVVNLDKGDGVIDRSSEKMAKAKGTTVVDQEDVEFGGLEGTTPIILLAHGSEDKSSSGTVWGQKFAGVSPKAIVDYLISGDKKQRLSKKYAGTVYLDGCFTAQVGGMDNYTKQVWEGLKAKGFKDVKVKGNLGAAVTLEDGNERITTPEAKVQATKLEQEATKALEKLLVPYRAKKDEIWDKKYSKKGGDRAGYDNDAEIKKLKADMKIKRDEMAKKLETELKKIPGYKVDNLVGQFGLELLK